MQEPYHRRPCFPPSGGQTASPSKGQSPTPLQQSHLWLALFPKAIEQNRGRIEPLRLLDYFLSVLVILMLRKPDIRGSVITEHHSEAAGQLLGVTSVLDKHLCRGPVSWSVPSVHCSHTVTQKGWSKMAAPRGEPSITHNRHLGISPHHR